MAELSPKHVTQFQERFQTGSGQAAADGGARPRPGNAGQPSFSTFRALSRRNLGQT